MNEIKDSIKLIEKTLHYWDARLIILNQPPIQPHQREELEAVLISRVTLNTVLALYKEQIEP